MSRPRVLDLFSCAGGAGMGYHQAGADVYGVDIVPRGGYTPANSVRKELMGIDWMTQWELTQAIPPVYTEFIGRQLMALVSA